MRSIPVLQIIFLYEGERFLDQKSPGLELLASLKNKIPQGFPIIFDF